MDTPGLKVGPDDDKLGIRGAPSAQVFLTDCAVGDDARLGPEGDGFKIAMRALDGGRIGIAAQALGIARAAFEDATRYALERKTFGQPIAEHQAIQFKLADMRTEIDAARLLLWRAAVTKDRGGRYGRDASMAKLFALRGGQPRRQGGAADLRRLRLPDRLPGRAALPGRQDHRDLRRNQRDPAPGHRFGLAQGVNLAQSFAIPIPRRDVAMGKISE